MTKVVRAENQREKMSDRRRISGDAAENPLAMIDVSQFRNICVLRVGYRVVATGRTFPISSIGNIFIFLPTYDRVIFSPLYDIYAAYASTLRDDASDDVES